MYVLVPKTRSYTYAKSLLILRSSWCTNGYSLLTRLDTYLYTCKSLKLCPQSCTYELYEGMQARPSKHVSNFSAIVILPGPPWHTLAWRDCLYIAIDTIHLIPHLTSESLPRLVMHHQLTLLGHKPSFILNNYESRHDSADSFPFCLHHGSQAGVSIRRHHERIKQPNWTNLLANPVMHCKEANWSTLIVRWNIRGRACWSCLSKLTTLCVLKESFSHKYTILEEACSAEFSMVWSMGRKNINYIY